MRATVAVPCSDHLGEGAFWHSGLAKLFWLDIPPPSRLHILDPADGSVKNYNMPQMITCMRPWGSGLILGAHNGVFQFDFETGEWRRVVEHEPEIPFNRCNDGGTDAKGRFWFGTMQNNISPGATEIEIVENSGALYRLDSDMTLTKVVSDICISNTLCFSPENDIMYFCDTVRGVIWAYDYDIVTGTPGNRRDFARFDRGMPDGSCVDSEGGLWNARWGGNCVVRFLPDGSVDQVIEVPAARVTSVAFGGPELRQLYITTARWGIADPKMDGHLFVAEPGVAGLPSHPFSAPWG